MSLEEGWKQLRFIVLLLSIGIIGIVTGVFGNPSFPARSGTRTSWTAMNVLEQSQKITYALKMKNRSGSVIKEGSLKIDVKRKEDALRVYVDYRIGDVTGSVRWEPAPKFSFEGVIASFITRNPEAGIEDIKLLVSPFYFLTWQSNFAKMEWAAGNGWLTKDARPDLIFRVAGRTTHLGFEAFAGSLTIGESERLRIKVSTEIPLPLISVYYDPSGLIFESEMTGYEKGQV